MIYETDQGTLQLLNHLTADAATRLQHHLQQLAHNKATTITFQAADFAGRTDIKQLKLERHETKSEVLVATATMADGVLWRRGSLRVPGVVLPETIRIGAKGKLLEEVVEGAPFNGFTVTSLVQDGSGKTGKLRICCTASRTGPIVANVTNAPEPQSDDLAEALLVHADVNIDAVAERALRLLGRDKAFAILLNIINGNTHYAEKLEVRYGALLEGCQAPHLAIPAMSHTGTITLFRRKAGIRSNVMVNISGYPIAYAFDKCMATVATDKIPGEIKPKAREGFLGRLFNKLQEAPESIPFEPTVRSILGFDAPKANISGIKKNGDWGLPAYLIDNDCTIGSLVADLR